MTQQEFLIFIKLVGKLRTTYRHCWSPDGRQESVAEHCYRLAFMPLLLKDEFSDVNLNKVMKMCLIHDLGEAVTGDIPAFMKTDDQEADEMSLLFDLFDTLPDTVAEEFKTLHIEMNALVTKEAKLYKALDNLEALMSHNESELSTWLPVEYHDMLTYGEDKVAWNEWLVKLREAINKETIEKIDSGK